LNIRSDEPDLITVGFVGAFSLQKTSLLSSAHVLGSPEIVMIGFPVHVVPEKIVDEKYVPLHIV